MANASGLFQFDLQHIVEQLLTTELLAYFNERMPQSWKMLPLSGAEQHLGDLELTNGKRRIFIELKAEDYARSQFIEPVQFWLKGASVGHYKRSWVYTTTAPWMLYLSTVTGTLMLCPRRPWLQSGVDLLEAYLFAGLEQTAGQEPYRCSVTLNSQGYGASRVFSGGAAGSGVDTETWLRAYAERGYDLGHIHMADGSDILTRARRRVADMAPESMAKFVRAHVKPGRLNKPGAESGIMEALKTWATGTVNSDEPVARQIRKTYNSLHAEHPPEPSVEALVETLQSHLPRDANDALDASMWFLATACLQCGWAKNYEGTAALVTAARTTSFRLDSGNLPTGQAVPPAMREVALRLADKFDRRGARPNWGQVRHLLNLDPAERLELQRAYVSKFRHQRAKQLQPA